MQDQKFAYNTLNRDIKEIRLIALQPCTDATAAIECKILNAKLVDEPRYEALSYMWGGEADPQIIKIDGKEHQIRHNLWLALIQLRPADEERIIWIDAVCINQEDIEERNHQVGFMSFIYSQAHHVIAWLGPETETSHEAMEFLNRLLDGTIPIVNCDRLPFNGKWDAVQQLCEMQYWGRLWIIQEVVLAPQVTFWCGKDTLSEEAFIKIPSQFVEHGKHRTWNGNTVQKFSKLLPVRLLGYRRSIVFSDHALIEILFEFKEAICQDARDKIFGLFFLSKACCKAHVVVDYSKTAYEICRDAVAHYLQEHFPSKGDFAASAELAETVHYICDKDYNSTNTPDVGESRSSFKRLLSTIIYTTPLSTIEWEPETTPPSWFHYLPFSVINYLQAVWNDLGYTQVGQDPAIRSIISRKLAQRRQANPGVEIWDIYAETLGISRYSQDVRENLPDHLTYYPGVWCTSWDITSSPWSSPGISDLEGEEELEPQDLQIEIPLRERDYIVRAAWDRFWQRDYRDIHARKLAHIVRKFPRRFIPESDIKLFIDNNGMIGLTSKDTLPYDSIWKVDSPGSLVIARKTENGYETIARSTSKQFLLQAGVETSSCIPPLNRHLKFVASLNEEWWRLFMNGEMERGEGNGGSAGWKN